MYTLLTRYLAIVVAILVAARYVPGIAVDDLETAAVVALVLGLINLTVRPVLMILTLPVMLVTFGLFIFVVNAALFWFVGSFVEGFSVAGFVPALLGSCIVSAVSFVASKFT